jgi:hypothetical protein
LDFAFWFLVFAFWFLVFWFLVFGFLVKTQGAIFQNEGKIHSTTAIKVRRHHPTPLLLSVPKRATNWWPWLSSLWLAHQGLRLPKACHGLG